MDHHCPWINNCVGYYTQKPFVLFLMYVLLASVYASVVVVKDLTKLSAMLEGAAYSPFYGTLLGICTIVTHKCFIAVFALLLIGLAGIFTMFMLADQYSTLRSVSVIDRKQGNAYRQVLRLLRINRGCRNP